jgi:hypothetical protein
LLLSLLTFVDFATIVAWPPWISEIQFSGEAYGHLPRSGVV